MSPKLLHVLGPQQVKLSGELISLLEAEGVKASAARQLLSRAASQGQVWRSEKFKLPKNQRLFAHREFAGTPEFYRQAAGIVALSDRQGISRCLALLANEGVAVESLAQKVLATPIVDATNSNKYPGYSEEVLALHEFGISEQMLLGGHSYLVPEDRFDATGTLSDSLALKQLSRYRIECMLAKLLVDTLRRQNFLTWNRHRISDPLGRHVDFNGQLFSAFSYSFLRPLTSWRVGKPTGCPVLIDVIPGKCSLYDFEGFIERIKRATFRGKKQQNYLGIIAAPDFEKQVWKKARQQALLTVNLKQNFGEAALDALAEFEVLFRAIDPAPGVEPEANLDSIANLLSELKTNPIVTDLRSIAFEALTALAMRAEGYEDITMGTDVPFQHSTRDVDVHGRRGDEAAIIECKAIMEKNDLSSTDVTKFFTETVPAFTNWYRQKHGNFKALNAQLWTTGNIRKDTQGTFDSLKLAKNVNASLKDQNAISASFPNQIKTRLQKLLTIIALPTNSGKL